MYSTTTLLVASHSIPLLTNDKQTQKVIPQLHRLPNPVKDSCETRTGQRSGTMSIEQTNQASRVTVLLSFGDPFEYFEPRRALT